MPRPRHLTSFASGRLLLRIPFTSTSLRLLGAGRPNFASLATALGAAATALLLALLRISLAFLARLAFLHGNGRFCVDLWLFAEHRLDKREVLHALRLVADVAGFSLRARNELIRDKTH